MNFKEGYGQRMFYSVEMNQFSLSLSMPGTQVEREREEISPLLSRFLFSLSLSLFQ